MNEPQVPIGVYVGEAEPGLRIGKVTVTWWEMSDTDNVDDFRYQAQHHLEVKCEFWAGDEGTMDEPDHWQITWFHYFGIIADELGRYLADCCPQPDRIREAALAVKLPRPLLGLFDNLKPRVPNETAMGLLEG